MSSEVWPQYAESFRAYDLNGDGYITYEDLRLLQTRLSRSGEFNQHMEKLWKFLSASLDVNRDQRVDLDEWFEAWAEMREIADSYDSFPAWFQNYCDFIFDLLDEDGDGRVEEAEYDRLLQAFGRQPLPGVFASLDVDNAGSLSRRQLREAIFDFTCVNHERNVRFWGQPGGPSGDSPPTVL